MKGKLVVWEIGQAARQIPSSGFPQFCQAGEALHARELGDVSGHEGELACKGMAQNEKSQYPRKNSSSSAIRRTCQSSRGWLFTFSRHLPSSVKVRDTSNIGLLLSSRTEIVCSPRPNITD